MGAVVVGALTMVNLDHVRSLLPLVSDDPGHDMGGHILTLWSIARFLPARRIVEIGVDDGSSTYPLLLAAVENGGFLTSIDMAHCVSARRRIAEDPPLAAHWRFIQGDSKAVAADFFTPLDVRDIDLILIDGDHSPEGVRGDWLGWSPLVRVGGLVVLHDAMNTAEFPGIAALIEDTIKPDPRWECATIPTSYGLTVCRKLA